MKTSAGLLAAVLVWLAAGCATPPKIDWATRVGNYTFDQTVTEIGPPDKQARLTDGTVVAEWVTQRGRTHAFVSGGYNYGWPYGSGAFGPGYMDTVTTPEFFLRLTFGPDGKLAAWQKFAR